MSAAAWYHDKVSPRQESLEAFLAESRTFATDELLPALFKGSRLGADERARVRERLSYFTGLSPGYIDRANLRIQGFRFAKELLREEGLATGLLDARYTTNDIDDLEADPAGDAADMAISSAFKSAIMAYLRDDLGVNWDRIYQAPGDDELNNQWRYRDVPDGKPYEPKYINTAHDLSDALRHNPSLKVMVASGYYDLVTPFFDAEYTLGRHDIMADQLVFKYYGGGHMMYLNEPSRTQLLEDARTFIQTQLAN